jgi:hypothetical protein
MCQSEWTAALVLGDGRRAALVVGGSARLTTVLYVPLPRRAWMWLATFDVFFQRSDCWAFE